MKKYVLDTNLYIRAFRSRQSAAELRDFVFSFTPGIYLSSVVLHELLVGASTPAKARQIQHDIARPLKRTGRLVTPSHAAWETGAGVLSRMAREERLELRRVPKSLVHDVLIAVSCREAGVIVVTDNTTDFARIRRFAHFEFLEPWPA